MFMNRLFIIGAGGHGKVIADTAVKNGYTNIAFLDDKAVGSCMGFAVWGNTTVAEDLNDGATDFIIGVGDNQVRQKIVKAHPDLRYVSLIHPLAVVSSFASIGKGTVVMAGAIVNVCARIVEHCIINTAAIVEHDDVLEDFVHISPNAALGGTVHIGTCTHIGIGAAVKNNVDIYGKCKIGAGAVVVKDITESATYVGVPAKKLQKG